MAIRIKDLKTVDLILQNNGAGQQYFEISWLFLLIVRD